MDYLAEYLHFNTNRRDRLCEIARNLKRRGHNIIFNSLCNDYINVFKWQGKHTTIDYDLIEKEIMFNGVVAFTKSLKGLENYPFIAKATGYTSFGYYCKPTAVLLSDFMGQPRGTQTVVLDSDIDTLGKCVLCTDNRMGEKPIHVILYYAMQLSTIRTKIIQCVTNIRGASIVSVPEEQLEQAKNIYRDIDEGKSITFLSTSIENLDIKPQILTTDGASEELKTLYESYDKTYNDYLQSLGVQANNEIDKKSGISPVEVVANRSVIRERLQGRLEVRRKAIEQMKRIGIEGIEVSMSDERILNAIEINEVGKNESKLQNENEVF